MTRQIKFLTDTVARNRSMADFYRERAKLAIRQERADDLLAYAEKYSQEADWAERRLQAVPQNA